MFAALFALSLLAAQPAERIVDVRVQGNTLTAEADIVRIADVPIGSAFEPHIIDDVTARVRAGGRFARVEVLKRYASIADLSQIVLVIIVDEGRVVVKPAKDGQPAHAVRRRGPALMYLPLLGSDEGYAFTYGALVTMANPAGAGTRLSFPITWGGERSAGVELEKRLDTPKLTRIEVDGLLLSRRNDALGATDTRQQVWVRGQREIARALRLGAWGGADFVSFAGVDSQVLRTGVEAVVDTRVDPMLSRNAVYARAAVERLAVHDGPTPIRTVLDVSGYLPGLGRSTIVVRLFRDGANEPLPPYLKVLLGLESTLRGFRAGTAAGDSTAAGTVEVRLPVTSPLNIAKLGVRAFIDTATVYDAGARLQDQHFDRGVGGGVWVTATVIRFAVDVAHGSGGSTRVQLSSGITF